jgi:hypothetical protein
MWRLRGPPEADALLFCVLIARRALIAWVGSRATPT